MTIKKLIFISNTTMVLVSLLILFGIFGGVFDIPILMVTAKTETIDKIRGLGLGADDYIAKPFDPAELMARVQAHLKRFERLTGISREKETDKRIESGSTIIIRNICI